DAAQHEAAAGDERMHVEAAAYPYVGHGTTTSRMSAARMRAGIGTGRSLARSTHTWTKRPAAAGSSSPRRKMPISKYPDVVPSRTTRSPTSIASGNESGFANRQLVSTA